MQGSEANRAIDMEGAYLFDDGVFVIWNWRWLEPTNDEQIGSESLDGDKDDSETECDPEVGEDIRDGEEDSRLESDEHVTYTEVFKCIGASRDPNCQEVLASASQQLKKGNVEVQLRLEPENPFDSRAVEFVCKVDNQWKRIGYVVREALDAVHDAMNKKTITSVEFGWVKYLLHWSRSGPGWYAGISITKKGQWPAEVVRCSSTRKY